MSLYRRFIIILDELKQIMFGTVEGDVLYQFHWKPLIHLIYLTLPNQLMLF